MSFGFLSKYSIDGMHIGPMVEINTLTETSFDCRSKSTYVKVRSSWYEVTETEYSQIFWNVIDRSKPKKSESHEDYWRRIGDEAQKDLLAEVMYQWINETK